MKKKYFILYTLFLLFCIGCNEREIELYESSNYIQFQNAFTDSVTISFAGLPGQDEYKLPVGIRVSGFTLKEAMPYALVVDEKLTTAELNRHFELPLKPVFPAGSFIDTCYILLRNFPELQIEEKRIVLKIQASSPLLLGETDYSVMIIRLNDLLTQPGWWNAAIRNRFLGEYSERKYRAFIRATGISDMSGYSEDMLRNYSLIFKRWLKQQVPALTEENGSEITVPVNG